VTRLPIRLRVTLIFAAIMAVVLAATGLFLRLRLEHNLNQSMDQDLQSRGATLVSLIRTGELKFGEAVRSALRERGTSFAQVLTPSGKLFEPGVQRGAEPMLSVAEAHRIGRSGTFVERSGAPGLGDEPVRLLATPIPFERHRLIVVVGTSLAARNDALRSLTTLLLIGGPIALVLASLAAYWTVGAALRPVEAMRRYASDISAAESQRRLPVPEARDELRRLGETLNQMLDRLQTALERERAFVDDASHELRTPLALHKSELELALRYGGTREELRAAIASAGEEADRLSQLAENLLVIARSDKGVLQITRERLQVSDLFATVAQRLSGRAREADRNLDVADANGLAVDADRLRVEQALTNLVENALRHGAGTVRLWAQAQGQAVELHVSDAGPGFSAEFLPHAFERFARADAARAEGGAGLGLAIVDAVAQAHSGHAGARNTPGGGADVWIELASVAKA
jgi:two-component system, OmpR family, sensor kinase